MAHIAQHVSLKLYLQYLSVREDYSKTFHHGWHTMVQSKIWQCLTSHDGYSTEETFIPVIPEN